MEDRGGWLSRAGISEVCLTESVGGGKQQGILPCERDEAAAELEKLAEQGNVHAQFLTGVLYRDGGLLILDSEEARYWIEQAAKHELP